MRRPGLLTTEREEVTLRRLRLEDAPEFFDTIDANREHLSQFGEPTSRNNPTLEYVADSIMYPDPQVYGRWVYGTRKILLARLISRLVRITLPL